MTSNNNNSIALLQATVSNLEAIPQDIASQVDAFRNVYHNQVGEDREQMRQLRVNARIHLYILMGAYSGVCQTLLDPANEQSLVDLLGQHGLAPAPAGSNPYRPLADMLFGEWKDVIVKDKSGKDKARTVPKEATATRTVGGKKQFFVPNRSAEKYAKVARYAASQSWKPEEFAEKMSTFKGGMDGVLKADTAATRGTDQDEAEIDQLVELVHTAEPKSVLDFSDVGIGPKEAERKLVSLWAEIKDGEVLIRGVLPTSEDTLKAYVRKYAKDNATTLLRQKLKVLSGADA